MKVTLDMAAGAGLGAWLMYLLDAERGRRRRAMARDKAVRLAHRTGDALETASRDLAHRASGLAAQARSRLATGDVPDDVLVQRVRSRMGRFVSHPRSIEVSARDGWVTLAGPVLASEVEDLVREAWGVRGVRGVNNVLEAHREPGDVPGLQGGWSRPGTTSELMQENWAPATRLLATLSGGSVALWGLRRGGLLGLALGTAGAAVLARGLTNAPIRRLVGAGGRRAVDVQKTLTLDAPVEEIFEFWTNVENFPRFMSHLREVRRTGEGRSRWVAAGPAGVRVEWDAEVTQLVPNELLAWRSVAGARVGNAGLVRFEPTPEGDTRLTIRMSYNPPAGALGHVVASLFGADPKHAMDEDLVRLQSLFAEGRTTVRGRQVTLDSIEHGTHEPGAEAPEPAEPVEAVEPIERPSSFEHAGSDVQEGHTFAHDGEPDERLVEPGAAPPHDAHGVEMDDLRR